MPIYPKEIKAGEDNPIEAAPILTMEDKEVIQNRIKVLEDELRAQQIAKYKIDLQLASGYSTLKPSAGILSFWESGSKFHGGGDAKMYICPGKERRVSECEAFIPDTGQGYGFGVCPKCQKLWKGEEMIGEVGYRLTSAKWADVLLHWYLRLDMHADLRIKYPPDDIRSIATREQGKQQHGELLQPTRMRRSVRIYPLRNIIKDTSAGADLYTRILAFVKA